MKNINLMISVKQIKKIVKPLEELNGLYSVKAMKKTKEGYELTEDFNDIKYCKLYLTSLKKLLNAPLGLYAQVKDNGHLTEKDKFRVELKKGPVAWEIDNE